LIQGRVFASCPTDRLRTNFFGDAVSTVERGSKSVVKGLWSRACTA
jgi:hypothetical protein